MRKLATWLGLVGTVLASSAMWSGVASAADCQPPRVLFVIDSSSSMRDSISENGVNTTKWDAAQKAVKDVLAAFPDEAQYGLEVFPGASGGCSLGEVLVDVAPGTGAQIQTALANINMNQGRSTPAGQSLMAASQYTGITDSSYQNYVVFISDGWQYCSIDQSSGPPTCASTQDCSDMNDSTCGCNSCQSSQTSDPNNACYQSNPDGCYCIREWPVKGVEALKAKGVTTYVVGFGAQVDARTLNRAADAAGTATTGCDKDSTSPSCYFQASKPSDLNKTLGAIVQTVVTEECTGDCGIKGEHTCTASGWSACDAPDTIECVANPCGAKGTQKCVNGSLTACDATCPDAGAGGSAGSAGAGGAGGEAGAAGNGSGGEAGAAGQAGAAGAAATGGNAGGEIDGGAPDTGTGQDAGQPQSGGGESGNEGGCACRTSTGSGGSTEGAFGLLALAGLALLRRRR